MNVKITYVWPVQFTDYSPYKLKYSVKLLTETCLFNFYIRKRRKIWRIVGSSRIFEYPEYPKTT